MLYLSINLRAVCTVTRDYGTADIAEARKIAETDALAVLDAIRPAISTDDYGVERDVEHAQVHREGPGGTPVFTTWITVREIHHLGQDSPSPGAALDDGLGEAMSVAPNPLPPGWSDWTLTHAKITTPRRLNASQP